MDENAVKDGDVDMSVSTTEQGDMPEGVDGAGEEGHGLQKDDGGDAEMDAHPDGCMRADCQDVRAMKAQAQALPGGKSARVSQAGSINSDAFVQATPAQLAQRQALYKDAGNAGAANMANQAADPKAPASMPSLTGARAIESLMTNVTSALEALARALGEGDKDGDVDFENNPEGTKPGHMADGMAPPEQSWHGGELPGFKAAVASEVRSQLSRAFGLAKSAGPDGIKSAVARRRRPPPPRSRRRSRSGWCGSRAWRHRSGVPRPRRRASPRTGPIRRTSCPPGRRSRS